MSILSTNKKLIKVGAEYSAGSGISIDNYVISVTGDVGGKTYSAGDNINIYTQDNQLYISGKDWSNDIADASANAYNAATAQIPEPQDLSYLSGRIDTNTSGIDYISSVCITAHQDWTDTIKGASSYSYEQSTSYFDNWVEGQYTGDITNITNKITALSGDLGDYYKKTETSSKDEINDALQYVSANAGKVYEGVSPIVVNNTEDKISADTWTFSAGSNVSFVDDNVNKITRIDVTAQGGDVEVNSFVYDNSAKINDVNSSYQSNSGTFLTAIPSQYATTGDVADLAQSISENYYPNTNPSSFVNEDWVTAQGYITGVDLSEYAERAFVLSSIESATSGKLDVSSFASVSSDFLTNDDLNGYATESFVENVSGDITALIPDTSNFITNTSAEATYQKIDGMVDYAKASALDNLTNDYSSNSGVWNEVSTTYQNASADYLTAHQSLDGYATQDWVTGQGYLTGINLPESATWNEASTTLQTNSSVWNDKLDSSSLDLKIGQHYDFETGITGVYKISGADILASNAFADSQGRAITGWYQLKDNNLLSGTKYGTLKIDNENTHLVDTTFSALSSYEGIIVSAIPESGVGYYTPVGYEDTMESTTSHSYDNVKSYSINLQSWDGGFTAQINGTNYDHSYFDGNHTITGEFNTPSTLVVNLYRSNKYMQPTIKQFNLGVAGQVNEVVDIRNVFATNEQLNTASSYLSGAIDYVSANAGGGNPEVESYVQTNSGTIDDTVTSFQTNSSTYMVEPNLEYNAVNEISGYNGSAIAQYGAEKQWLVHDDTLVHASNSAQYALGVNVSALQRLMGVDETVLFTSSWNDKLWNVNLSEPVSSFKKIRMYVTRGDGSYEPKYYEYETSLLPPYFTLEVDTVLTNDIYKYFTLCRLSGSTYTELSARLMGYPNALGSWNNTNSWCHPVKIVGIGRKN